MTLYLMNAPTKVRFNRLCKLVATETDGPGITLTEVGLCSDLARALDEDEPDGERVEELAERLGLEAEEVA